MRARQGQMKQAAPTVATASAAAVATPRAGAGGAPSLEHARRLGHSPRNLGGSAGPGPGGGEAVVDRSPLAALVRALQPVGAAGSVGGPTVVQRKGVKSELKAAGDAFQEFMMETGQIDQLRTRISNQIYQAYKPSSTGLFRNSSG